MDFKAESKNMGDVLTLNRKYIIPRFQREYSWENDELNILWEDLLDNLLIDGNNLKPQEYFIGSLVLVGDEENTSNIERYVVDGQQRLMTYTIVFSVLYQLFKNNKEDKLAKVIHRYIIGEDNDGKPLTKLNAETPKPFFQRRIQQLDVDFSANPKNPEEKKILNAYQFFEKKLDRKIFLKELENRSSLKDFDYITALKVFRDQMLGCKVIYVTVKSFDDAYMIFEVLNAKGKDLSPVDIIKNSIFSILTREEPLDDAAERWKSIKEKISLANDSEITTFYRHFWLSKYKFITNKKLVVEFNKTIAKTTEAYSQFLIDLENAGDDYKKISNPQIPDWKQVQDYPIYHSLVAYQIFGVTQVRTILLSLLSAKSEKRLEQKELINILQFLEYYHFVFTAVCSSRPSGLEQRYSSFARQLRLCKDNNESRKCLAELKKLMLCSIPDFDTFEKKFCELSYTSNLSQNKKLIQYILNKLECHITQSKELQPAEMTIEHILPEASNQSNVGMVGNLLPLGSKLNNGIGDDVFPNKLKAYQKSQFQTVSQFVKENAKKQIWSKTDIEARTSSLAKIFYYDIWKYKKTTTRPNDY